MQISYVTKIPKFERYGLITSESLNILSFNLFNFINAKYIDSSDGIIAGFDIKYDSENKAFLIEKGIVKIDGEIFWLNDNVTVDLPEKEGRYYCLLKFSSEINENYYIHILNFEIIEQSLYSNEFVLFEIIMRDGANISDNTKYFDEFRDEFNTINIINQKYCASYSKFSTISPKIMKKWAYIASHKLKIETNDLNFIFLCLNSIVSKELIIAYIKNKLNINLDICKTTNSEILKYLSSILNEKIKEEKKEIKKSEEYFYVN